MNLQYGSTALMSLYALLNGHAPQKNAKGCLAISWRASLSANTAEIVQEQLAGI